MFQHPQTQSIPKPLPGEPRIPIEAVQEVMRLSMVFMDRAQHHASRYANQRQAPEGAARRDRPGDYSVDFHSAAAQLTAEYRREAEDAWRGAGAGSPAELIEAQLAVVAARRAEAAMVRVAEGVRRQQEARCRPRGPRRPRGPHQYNDLRDAALALARARVRLGGPEAVTMAGLARDLGVSAAAVHAYFPRRADLLGAVGECVERELAPALAEVREAESPVSGLRLAARAMLSIASREPGTYRALAREGGAGRTIEPGWLPDATAYAAGRALAGGGPAARAAEAARPRPEPAPVVDAAMGSDEWYRQKAAVREWELRAALMEGPPAVVVGPEARRLGWMFTMGMHGVAQALAVGMVDARRAEELGDTLAALVAAAGAGPGS